MTEYRWIVLSLLAVFVLSAACILSDATCEEASCFACTGNPSCQWCTYGNSTSRVTWNTGVCQTTSSSCDSSAFNFIPEGVIGFDSFFLLVSSDRQCEAVDTVTILDESDCNRCVETGGRKFCSVSRDGLSTKVCLSEGTCSNVVRNDSTRTYADFTSHCCKSHSNCEACDAGGCIWCTPATDNNDFLNVGVCQPGSDCTVAYQGLTYLGLTLINVNDRSSVPCQAVAPPVHWDATTCQSCIHSDIRGHWCPLQVGDKSYGICLADAASCTVQRLKGAELAFTVSPPAHTESECCLINDNCTACTGNRCHWCLPTQSDGSRLYVGVCQTSGDCTDAHAGLAGLGLNFSRVTDNVRCTATAQPVHWSATTCKQCTADLEGHWCLLKKDGHKAGLCLRNDSCTIQGISTGFDGLEAEAVNQLGECCGSRYDNCVACTNDDDCSWCYPASHEIEGSHLNVGVCALTTSHRGTDTSCSNVTIGQLHEPYGWRGHTGLMIIGIKDTRQNEIPNKNCRRLPPKPFHKENTCADCVAAGHSWCPIICRTYPKHDKNGICSPLNARCDDYLEHRSASMNCEIRFADDPPCGNGGTDDDNDTDDDDNDTDDDDNDTDDGDNDTEENEKGKGSNAFSMFSGSAIGFISAVAISGFVM